MEPGLANDVYRQVGLVMLIGLSAKNAIPIEFSGTTPRAGMTIVEAAIEASKLRLRPILMTSLAFILGVLPLVFATGPARKRGTLGRHCGGGRHVRVHVPEHPLHPGPLRGGPDGPIVDIQNARSEGRNRINTGDFLTLFLVA